MTTGHFLRRLHLYLGLGLLPWLFMYGISSLPFAHNQYFNDRDAANGVPLWQPREERPFEAPVPAGADALREFGRGILDHTGLSAPNFGVYRANPNTVIVTAFSFLRTSRVVYTLDRKTLRVEDRRFRFDQFLTGLHARGGFEQDGILADSWGVVVDLVCAAMILWVVTGFYMWWGLPAHRRWGWTAILSGAAAFAVFTLTL
jgi:hypothetical protein